MRLNLPTTLGELLDKISILELKVAKIDRNDPRLSKMEEELGWLNDAAAAYGIFSSPHPDVVDGLAVELRAENEELWRLEDEARATSTADLTRLGEIYLQVIEHNKRRSKIKHEINSLYDDNAGEVKLYHE